ncbi:sugar ABC transporter ATP-binding protein, partial [Micromonospora sp. DH15]|nr:sugar ABC transporter ATP-binding protein [Micromonospora sp. DH15]
LLPHTLPDVGAVSHRLAALDLGQMVAQVKTTDITHSQVVELITAGRSGALGLAAELTGGNGTGGAAVGTTPGALR